MTMSNPRRHTGGNGAEESAPNPETRGAEAAEGSPAEVVEEKTPLELLQDEVKIWKDQAARAQAEFSNTRKRLEDRHATAVKLAGKRVIESVIPAIDDLELAERHAQDTDNEMAAGIAAIHAKLVATLVREGVEIVNPLDKPFDHNTATAVQMIENPEVPDQTVTTVLQKGYVLGGRVIRPAMVVVATGGSPAK